MAEFVLRIDLQQLARTYVNKAIGSTKRERLEELVDGWASETGTVTRADARALAEMAIEDDDQIVLDPIVKQILKPLAEAIYEELLPLREELKRKWLEGG